MKIKGFISLLLLTVIWGLIPCRAYHKSKIKPSRVDSFDLLIGGYPLSLLSYRMALAGEMRLAKPYTLNVRSSLMMAESPYFLVVENHEINESSRLRRVNEQNCQFLIKRYNHQKPARVYFGPYLALGMEYYRTNFKMVAQVPGFQETPFYFSTKRKSVVFAVGTTRLLSKRIIFDFYTTIKYQYKVSDQGNFTVEGRGYKKGIQGAMGFSLLFPVGKKQTRSK